MHRYSNLDYLLSLDFKLGFELINKAIEKDNDEQLYQIWIAQIPRYNASLLVQEIPKEVSCTFNEFKKKKVQSPQQQTVEQQIALCKALTLAYGGTVIEE